MSRLIKLRDHTKYVVVHSSETSARQQVDLRFLDRRDRRRGKFGLGCHFIIHRDGRIQVVQRLDQVGCHTKGYDEVSVGVVMLGGRKTKDGEFVDNYTDEQKRKLLSLHTLYFPDAKLVGHRDLVPATQCPHFDVKGLTEMTE